MSGIRQVLERVVGGTLRRMIRAANPRRTPEQNWQLMRERGEDPSTFVIRELREGEIDELAELHHVTWAATYPEVLRPPTAALRSWQWRDAFAKQDGHWFCYVVVNSAGKLVGFTRGIRNKDNLTEGDLNKIYLLSEYQRLGLGRRMLAAVTDRFLAMGVTSMTVHAEADNPSCRFYEATGAVNTIDEKTGKPNGGSFVWKDLSALKALLSK
jgi:GNAT superfamily N-acetyltransferase